MKQAVWVTRMLLYFKEAGCGTTEMLKSSVVKMASTLHDIQSGVLKIVICEDIGQTKRSEILMCKLGGFFFPLYCKTTAKLLLADE